MKPLRSLSAACLALSLAACGDDPVIDAGECVNALSSEEQAAGWTLLFDGKDLAQWRSYREEAPNSGWGVENGCLTRLGMGGDLISREQFGDFELKL